MTGALEIIRGMEVDLIENVKLPLASEVVLDRQHNSTRIY